MPVLGTAGIFEYALGVELPSALTVAKGPAPNWPGLMAVSFDCRLPMLGIAGVVAVEKFIVGLDVIGVDVCVVVASDGTAGAFGMLKEYVGVVVAGFTLMAFQLMDVTGDGALSPCSALEIVGVVGMVLERYE